MLFDPKNFKIKTFCGIPYVTHKISKVRSQNTDLHKQGEPMKGTLLHNGLEYLVTYQRSPSRRPIKTQRTFTKTHEKRDADLFTIHGEGLPTDIVHCILQTKYNKLYQLTVTELSPYGDKITAVGVPYNHRQQEK